MVLHSRQGIWLCGRLHYQHQRPDRHSAFLRCRLHLHHFPAPHAAGWSEGVHQGPEKWGRSDSQTETPEECETAPADVDGLSPSCGPLPQPYYSCPGKKTIYVLPPDNPVPHVCGTRGSIAGWLEWLSSYWSVAASILTSLWLCWGVLEQNTKPLIAPYG